MKKITFFKLTRFIVFLIVVFLIAKFIFGIVTALTFNTVVLSENIEQTEDFNILIGGTDLGGNRKLNEDGVRTDVLMLVSYDANNIRDNQALSVVSIPRDTNVYIPCANKSAKINTAAQSGIIHNDEDLELEDAAVGCVLETVENLFSTKIDYYAFANFDTFIELVDALDGVDVYNDYYFCEQDENGKSDAYCFDEKSDIHLDGPEALSYVRQRHESSDYERNQRQQVVVSQMVMKLLQEPEEYSIPFATAFATNTTTNISFDFIVSAINYFAELYNSYVTDISEGKTLILDFKTTPYSMYTAYDTEEALQLKSQNINGNLIDYYDTYTDLEYYNTISRYVFTDYNIGQAHIDNSEISSDEVNILELEFISLLVNESTTSSDTYPDPQAIEYVSEQASHGNDMLDAVTEDVYDAVNTDQDDTLQDSYDTYSYY